MNLIDIMKQSALDAVEESQPVKIVFGIVVNISPIRIKIEQKVTLDDDFLVFTLRIKKDNLNINDVVILLQMQGGQKFVVLDIISSEVIGNDTTI